VVRLVATGAVAVVAACGNGGDAVDAGSGLERYRVSATVLESPDHGPQLCREVLESLPPQCGGPDIAGWDWDEVDGEESASGTTWGTFELVGSWDGERFTLTDPAGPPPTPHEPEGVEPSTPCPEPSGGWVVVDPATATLDAQTAANEYARAQPDLGGLWVDQSINPALADGFDASDEGAANDPTLLVLNVAFTGDLARHERELRAIWGGPLCVSEAEHSQADLMAIEASLPEEGRLGSWVDVISGTVHGDYVLVDPALQTELDRLHGEGVVVLESWLQPVD
jgi:hypothetical protein